MRPSPVHVAPAVKSAPSANGMTRPSRSVTFTSVPPGTYAVSAIIPNDSGRATALASYLVKDGATAVGTVTIDQAVVGLFGNDTTTSFGRVDQLYRYTDLDRVAVADGKTAGACLRGGRRRPGASRRARVRWPELPS